MSYLNSPRLTFSGQFQADVSTVNNDPTHFNNKTFKPSYQKAQTATAANGWWNPDGTGNWRLIGCKITTVTYHDGSSTSDPSEDPIIGMSIADTDLRTAGKLVDLDSQQQMVSQIWGLVVRIVSNDGTNILRSDYNVSPFMNVWFNRSIDLSASSGGGAVYQSVLTNLEWEENYSKSRYINELREVLKENNSEELSIQFNVDRYDSNKNAPTFTLGRMTGSIGPAFNNEPKQFVAGRHLFPVGKTCNYAAAIYDGPSKSLVLDMGNAFQFNTGGVIYEDRDLHLAVNAGSDSNPDYIDLGKINYKDPDWYMGTSGICSFQITNDQLEKVNKNPLAIIEKLNASTKLAMKESVDYVRAEKAVFRLDPGEQECFDFYATHLGRPLADIVIHIQDDTQNMIGPTPPSIGTPSLPFLNDHPNNTVVLTTDENGKASFEFEVPDPGNPRVYIDGQVYALTYNLSTQNFQKDCNPANFLSLLIYSGKDPNADSPTWDNFIQPIMQQYANLYPLMSKGIFNLADKNVFDSNAQILKLVFSKDKNDPNYMPATRDLSAYRLKIILDYLDTVIENQESQPV